MLKGLIVNVVTAVVICVLLKIYAVPAIDAIQMKQHGRSVAIEAIVSAN